MCCHKDYLESGLKYKASCYLLKQEIIEISIETINDMDRVMFILNTNNAII